jgi:hypothetical protein
MNAGTDPNTTSAPARPVRPLDLMVAACLIGVALFELAELHLHLHWAGLVAGALLVVFVLVGQARLGLRERYLLALAAAATLAALVLSDAPWELMQRGLGQATFLAAFMLLLALLRDGAVTSPSVLALGKYLTRRPPGQRYLAIHTGSHALGMILNFGALSLLGPLIQRGTETDAKDNPELAQWRLQRQMSALARGFSWIIAWSPTAVTQALVVSVVTGSKAFAVASIGLVVAAGGLLIGWGADRITGKRARASLASHDALPRPDLEAFGFPATAFARFAAVCLALATISGALIVFTGARVIPALMLASPIVTAAWVWVQFSNSGNGLSDVLARARHIATASIPAGSPEAVTLSAAGYIGIVAAGLANAPALAGWIGIDGWPPLAAYVAMMTLVPLASNLAAPPMLTVTFFGSLYSALPASHLDPSVLAASMALGWALNLTASPFGATALILGRITGIPGTTLSWKWNTGFTLAMWLWAVTVLATVESLSTI